jgi:release factor glutamine methyltransferase
MSALLIKLLSSTLRKIARIYTSKEREFSYKGITVRVKPRVFHPGLFISTKILLSFVDSLTLLNKSFLELGGGTGVISILAAKKNAVVHSSDMSSLAIDNIEVNAVLNNVDIRIYKSDLFKEIPQQVFDLIIINPPYYNKDPENEEEYAWYCGSNFEYFHSLFHSLSQYINENSQVFMILSEVCDIDKIKAIGNESGFLWEIILQKKIWGEENYIFRISQS